MTLITTNDELKKFCDDVRESGYITVDTEFLREKTYWPKLCLIQIAGAPLPTLPLKGGGLRDHAAAIDPLAEAIDLTPVWQLLSDKNVLKVFHACRQDIEIFYHLTGKMPEPIFDTQVAAAVCGYGESVSYETLVNKIVDAELDKSSRFTDWSARPLSDKQLAYALSDVTHLRLIYDDLKLKIEAAGRERWIESELATLTNPKLYDTDPRDSWKRLKYGNMRPKHLAVLRELAQWREIEARKGDVPRGRIFKDEVLVELASVAPRKEADLDRLRSLAGGISKSKIAQVLECVERALAMPQTEWPQVAKHKRQPEHVTGAVAMLSFLLKVKADQHGIAPSLIAGKDDLEQLALGDSESSLLSGWRFDVFGKKARAMLDGKLLIALNPKNGKVVFEERE
ncbi:MAG: ribonuclease D [Rickettsiales bacterium]|jgi:ribonuclease D|nr:ribonuclease D [Rickettsiales bacterium]